MELLKNMVNILLRVSAMVGLDAMYVTVCERDKNYENTVECNIN